MTGNELIVWLQEAIIATHLIIGGIGSGLIVMTMLNMRRVRRERDRLIENAAKLDALVRQYQEAQMKLDALIKSIAAGTLKINVNVLDDEEHTKIIWGSTKGSTRH